MTRIRTLFAEALRSIGANVSTTVASALSVLIGMFLIGVFIGLGTWLVSWSDDKKRELAVHVFIADRATTLNQVAIDPAFARTGFMWVSETRTSAFGRRTFTVSRYRVVKNRAGERTEIVSGIALPPSGNALFAIGGTGHIYVAVPGSPDISQPYWGTVLRFNADGSVPPDQKDPKKSPVIAAGYTFPHAIALGGFSDTIWLNGTDQ